MYEGLTFARFAEAATRSIPKGAEPEHYRVVLDVGALNLGSEAGEVIGAIKDHLHFGKALDAADPKDSKGRLLRQRMKDEVGDVLWALNAVCVGGGGFSLEEAAQGNVEKLRKRYPSGFSEAAAQARMDER